MSAPVAISYSGGASSEWLVRAALRGRIERPKRLLVVTADTGAEHEWTYEAIARVAELCQSENVPFVRCNDGSLLDELLEIPAMTAPDRADHPPLWVRTETGRGRIGHRCTVRFKSATIRRAITQWLRGQGLPHTCESWIGFAADEAHRAQRALYRQARIWNTLRFPAVELGITRAQQRAELQAWTGTTPPRFSMCVFCPFKTPARWRQTTAHDLVAVYAVDEAIRDLSSLGVCNPAYLTDRLIPVQRLIERGDPQPSLPGLESTCDAGACFL
jgi:hypothetical protein